MVLPDFRAAYDMFPNIVWTSSGGRGWDYANPRWTEFTGRRIEDEVGSGWTDRIHADDREGALSQLDEATSARRPFTLEFRARRHDGEFRWLASAGLPLPDGGYVGSCADVTERRAREGSPMTSITCSPESSAILRCSESSRSFPATLATI